MTLNIGDSKNSTRKLLEMVHRFHQCGGIQSHKVNLYNQQLFYIPTNYTGKRSWRPFTIALRKKNLEINLTKEVKDLYKEHFLSLRRKR